MGRVILTFKGFLHGLSKRIMLQVLGISVVLRGNLEESRTLGSQIQCVFKAQEKQEWKFKVAAREEVDETPR